MRFGSMLATLRRRRRLSQMALADIAGVSQRHISFLESGRAQPGRTALTKLGAVLAPDYAARNALFAAAGFGPPCPAFDWDGPAFASARAVIARALARHAPYPGLVMDRAGVVLSTNPGVDRALTWAFEGGPGAADPWAAVAGPDGRPNLYDLTLHDGGLWRCLVNPEAVIPHCLRRLRTAADLDPAAAAVLRRLRGTEAARRFGDAPEPPTSALASVVPEVYRVRGETLRLVSMVAGFGSPEDVTAQTLQIELFYPEDAASRALLERLAAETAGTPDHDHPAG
ncbi:helix-turn-helix domain-containing protein [Roseospira goensis]|uniref:DNA-binding XRE family transcriptional regulator n=1 Tax=Roseospira goensis TaxID=391922 RepID=A0A7W6RXJ0_9PROT|nr:helix-turn-helix domain-containing protein [Roseospira goensis]MBB4285068.1 DNA-binding XRE family transcriptional regulator [Roseospira goensis]